MRFFSSCEIVKNSMRKKKPEEQFKRDIDVFEAYLNARSPTMTSKERKNIVKRLFVLFSKSEIHLSRSNHVLPQNEVPIPLASMISHGGRILIQVPPAAFPNEKNSLLYWLTGGKDKILRGSQILTKHVIRKAEKTHKPVYQRLAATHAVLADSDGKLHEKLLFSRGLTFRQKMKTYLMFLENAIKERHMGVDLGLNEPDCSAPENGCYGHLYLHWIAPTTKRPGALLVGCEGSAPGKKDKFGHIHDHTADSPEFSATGGSKFWNNQFAAYNIFIKRVDGMRIDLTPSDLNTILLSSEKDFDSSLLRQPIKRAEDINPDKNCSSDISLHRI